MKNLILLTILLTIVSCIKNETQTIETFTTLNSNSVQELEQDCIDEIDLQYGDDNAPIELLEMKQECIGAFND